MKNMKVSKKLILSFVIIIVFAIAVGLVGMLGMNRLQKSATKMYDENIIAIEAMAGLRELFGNERNELRSIFLNQNNPESVNKSLDKFNDYKKIANEQFANYEKTIAEGDDESAYFKAKDAYLGSFEDMKNEVIPLIKSGEFDKAYEIFMNGSGVIIPITEGFARCVEQNNEWALEADKDTTKTYITLTIIMAVVLLLTISTSLWLALYISGLISKPLVTLSTFMKQAGSTGDIVLRPEDVKNIQQYAEVKDETGECISSTANFINHINEISGILEIIAGGDLTPEISMLSDKDTMAISLKKMLENLNEMCAGIKDASEQVSTGSKQIAEGAQTLASGSTEQASSVEELSSSVYEIAEATKVTADKANKAAQLTESIKDDAQKGESEMNNMMEAVKEINESSQNINKVIKVIDDIAFQTNILALNAAVEAARAGAAGKGFAVVADEVRNLASKSAEAAKNTSDMISNSIEKAELGSRIAKETSESLEHIVSGIIESAEIIKDIAFSSEDQANKINQINIGIGQVSEVVQQNSATAEESAAAAEEMSGQTIVLEGLVSQFKLR